MESERFYVTETQGEVCVHDRAYCHRTVWSSIRHGYHHANLDKKRERARDVCERLNMEATEGKAS